MKEKKQNVPNPKDSTNEFLENSERRRQSFEAEVAAYQERVAQFKLSPPPPELVALATELNFPIDELAEIQAEAEKSNMPPEEFLRLIVEVSQTDPRADAIKLFAEQHGNNFTDITSREAFAQKRKQIALQIDQSEQTGLDDYLFSYYGDEVVPYIFPEVKRNHLTIDYAQKEAIDKKQTLEHLPTHINGIPTEELIDTMVKKLANNKKDLPTTDRYALANGMCTIYSLRVARDFVSNFPELMEHLSLIRIDAASRRDKDSLSMIPLSDGHTIIGIKYEENDKKKNPAWRSNSCPS